MQTCRVEADQAQSSKSRQSSRNMHPLCFPSSDVESVRIVPEITSLPSLTQQNLVYLFLGSIIVGGHWYQYIPGTIIGVIGIAYIVLEFIPSIEPPANMRDADASWGSEQI